jgi:Tol biopolymer transport system component
MRDRLEEPEYHLAVVTPGQPAPQLYSVSGTEAAPQWSPDGNWLAYISYEERVAGANVFATAAPTAEPLAGQTPQFAPTVDEADIWIVDPAGQTKYPLTRFDTGSATRPRWSPDSDLISFVYSPSPGNDMIWMIANQPQAFATQLTLQWSLALDHTWLPDSSHIIASLRDFNEQSANQLWQMPLVGGDDANIIAYREELEIAHADFPRFSPDGHWLAVRSAYELWLINLESGEQRALDPITFGNSPAVWSPAAFEGEAAC